VQLSVMGVIDDHGRDRAISGSDGSFSLALLTEAITTTSDAPPRSWKSILANNLRSNSLSLSYFPPTVIDGHIEVNPPKEVLLQGVEKWANCLVGSRSCNFDYPLNWLRNIIQVVG
jgi:hypothetical protein